MYLIRYLSVLATLVLLASLNLARGADKVLVPGNPPLTQETVDLYQEMWEWCCDVKLTPEQRRQFPQYFAAFWSKRDRPANERSLAGYRFMEKKWDEIRDLKQPEQDRKRAQMRSLWMTVLRKSKDNVDLFLVGVYDQAFKAGGRNNPILVAGEPPFTQAMSSLDRGRVECIFGLILTDDQAREFQRHQIADWKNWDQKERRQWAKTLNNWSNLAAWDNYKRTEQRALSRERLRQKWAAKPTSASAWLLAIDAEVFKEGSARNPVLVAAQPPLTQLLVDRYADYLEIIVDLSDSGGFTEMERQIVQEYLVKRWTAMDEAPKNELIADLQSWTEATVKGGDEPEKYVLAMRPKFLAQLRVASDDPLSLWLLEVRKRETDLHRRNMELEKRRHESALHDIANIPKGPTGHWEYNSRTRRYDRWVDDQ
jgi:hypothetical protein